MKKLSMHLAIFIGAVALLAAFYVGWELMYHDISGTLFSFTRMMINSIYLVFFIIMLRLYGACQFGRARVGHLVYSQVLAELLSAALIYVVAVANCRQFINPLPLLLIMVIQFVISVAFCLLGNHLYFCLNKPKKSVILYRDKADLEKIREIDYFEKKFRVEKYIENPCSVEEILPQLAGYGVIFVTGIDSDLRNAVAEYCMEYGISGYLYPGVGDVIMMNAEHMHAFSIPMVRVKRASPSPEYLFVKRIFDIVASLAAIILTSVFMLGTAIAVKAYDGGPVLYKQVRLTKDGKRFKILKFRSMRVDAEKNGVARLASDKDDRITPVGKVIRACRLDELPQLFNILKGDMSVVGPRPERPEIAADYEKTLPAFRLRLQAKAGLTGYAQVYGRYNTEPKDKLKMDLMYIHNMGVLEDLRLCLYTVKILFMKDSTQGVAEGQTTALEEVEEKEKEPVGMK